MMALLASAATPWLTLALLAAVVIAAALALLSRALFASCLCLVVSGAMACALLVVQGAYAGAVLLALVSVGWGPLFLLAGVMLSKRTATPMRARPWLSIAAGGLCAGLAFWAVLTDAPTQMAVSEGSSGGVAFWLTLLMCATAAACVGVLGFGERGVLSLDRRRGDET